LVNPFVPPHAAIGTLPRVNGITVNTVHGNQDSIARVVDRVKPDVESMEGAAFMYACLMSGRALRAGAGGVEHGRDGGIALRGSS
jgi:hypothetical protein